MASCIYTPKGVARDGKHTNSTYAFNGRKRRTSDGFRSKKHIWGNERFWCLENPDKEVFLKATENVGRECVYFYPNT